jgi:membrane associated rhomboid family serine protease
LTSPVTLIIIFVTVIVSIIDINSRKKGNYNIFYNFAEWPFKIVEERKIYQVFTSGFLHADYLHLFFNMFTLYSFGTVLESLFIKRAGSVQGSIDFLLVYFISMLIGSVITVISNYKDEGYVAVGASGAVSGIIFSYILFFPMSMVGMFFVPMPAWLFAFVYIGVSIYGMKQKLGNIGHEAHLGGALGGVLATLFLIQGAFQILIGHFR